MMKTESMWRSVVKTGIKEGKSHAPSLYQTRVMGTKWTQGVLTNTEQLYIHSLDLKKFNKTYKNRREHARSVYVQEERW